MTVAHRLLHHSWAVGRGACQFPLVEHQDIPPERILELHTGAPSTNDLQMRNALAVELFTGNTT